MPGAMLPFLGKGDYLHEADEHKVLKRTLRFHGRATPLPILPLSREWPDRGTRFAGYDAGERVRTMYSDRVPMRNFPPQMPRPELT